jgi:hypothetical protein
VALVEAKSTSAAEPMPSPVASEPLTFESLERAAALLIESNIGGSKPSG